MRILQLRPRMEGLRASTVNEGRTVGHPAYKESSQAPGSQGIIALALLKAVGVKWESIATNSTTESVAAGGDEMSLLRFLVNPSSCVQNSVSGR